MASQTLKWTIGLIFANNKYLTAESFQSKVSANGSALKKKQIWTLERVDETDFFSLKSCFNRYLSLDSNGKVTGAAEEVGPDQKLTLETQQDGKVTIKSSHGRYFGGSGDDLSAFATNPDTSNYFTLQLAIHPQVNLRNLNRRTYCHLVDNEIRCDEVIPWGYDALIVIEFHGGRYALRAANGEVLKRTGELVKEVNNDTLYTLVFCGSNVAFRDCQGKYLTAVGATATVQSRKGSIGRDEQFALEDSHPQIRLTASNGKLVSIRDKLEVRANQSQDASSDAEIFQMEAVDQSDRSGNVKWAFRTNTGKYFSSTPGLKADLDTLADPSAQFEVEWQGPMITLKASNGKYVSVKSNGKMSADSAELGENCKFVFELINRPILVLRGEHGFVGVKGSSGILECNRSQYDIFSLENKDGTFNIRGANGKYMGIDGDTVTIINDQPTDFYLELKAHTHMTIRMNTGKLLQGSSNGGFSAKGASICSATLWEY